METVFSTSECSWSQVSMRILGRTLTGLRGFEINKEQEKEFLYGSDANPIDITSGNIKNEITLKLLKYEVDLMNDAAREAGFEDILAVPHTLIHVNVKYERDGKIKTTEALGIGWTALPTGMDQNAKFTEVSLKGLCLKIVHS